MLVIGLFNSVMARNVLEFWRRIPFKTEQEVSISMISVTETTELFCQMLTSFNEWKGTLELSCSVATFTTNYKNKREKKRVGKIFFNG